MADEEKVVEEKKSGGGGGIIPLITLVMVVVSIGISAFSLIQVMGISSTFNEMQKEANKPELIPGSIDVNDIQTFSFTNQFIFQYPKAEDPSKTNTVVVNIGVGVLTNEDTAEDAAAVMTLLSSKEDIVRDGLETMMKSQKFEDFTTAEGEEKIKTAVIEYLQGRLVSELIVEIYFNNMVFSS